MATSVIIPAHNEASRIAEVITAAQAADLAREVIVVDDGSFDDTFDIAESMGAIALRHDKNSGKAEAMQSGYLIAKELGSTSMCFLDADLRGLKSTHVDLLIEPIEESNASMTIGTLDRTFLQKVVLKRWGALSGQRALPMGLWEQLPDDLRTGFRVEAELNILTRKLGIHHDIQRITLDGVTHVGKREKEPTLVRAAAEYMRTYGSAVRAYGGSLTRSA